MREISGNPKDLMPTGVDENNFIETPDGRGAGKRNIAAAPVDGNGGTPAMRNSSAGYSTVGKVGEDAVENQVSSKPMTGPKEASRKLRPGHEV